MVTNVGQFVSKVPDKEDTSGLLDGGGAGSGKLQRGKTPLFQNWQKYGKGN